MHPEPLEEICPGLDADLYEGVNKAISKSPDDRYQTLEVFGEDLRRIRGRLDEGNEAATFIEPRPPRDEAANKNTDSGTPAPTPSRTPPLQEIARRRASQKEPDQSARRRLCIVSSC